MEEINTPASFLDTEAKESDEEPSKEAQEEENNINEYDEKDGFVIPDDNTEEVSEAKGEGEEGEDKGEKSPDDSEKKRRKKPREEEQNLDEEDLELIGEAIGMPLVARAGEGKRTFQRLKKRKTGEDLEAQVKESLFGSDDEEPEPSGLATQEPEPEEEIISDEDDDMRNFIEDLDENGNPIRQPKKKRSGPRLSSTQLTEAHAVFGEFDLDGEGFDETEQEFNKAPKLTEIYDPDDLARQFFTQEDEEIRATDLPEREQLRFPKRLPPAENEIKEEAEWIFSMAFSTEEGMQAQFVVPKIVYVLEFLRSQHLEIPFIFTYRKGYYLPDLELRKLWQIYDWDEKWAHLQSRKATLRQLYTQANVAAEYFKLLEESQTETEVQDLFDHFQMYFSEELADTAQRKRALKRDYYKLIKKTPVSEFSKLFGLSAQQFGQNLMNNYMSNQPIDQQEEPQELAQQYTCNEFPDSESVLKAARSSLAQEFGTDPLVRQTVRTIYHDRAQIFTFPTNKGKKEVDAFHPYRAILRIEKKPAIAFTSIQFLEILKAEKEGFITLKVEIPQDYHENELLHEMEGLYLSEGYNLWNEERKLIIRAAFSQHLYPLLEKELRQKLTEDAAARVTVKCMEKLHNKIIAGPYRLPPPTKEATEKKEDPPEKKEDLKVMTCCWGPVNMPTLCVVLDQEGEVISHIKLSFLGVLESDPRRAQDTDKLKQFITEHKPHIIGIGAQFESRRLYEDVRAALSVTEPNLPHNVHLTYLDPEVSRIYQSSTRAEREFSDFPPTLRQAISLGRMLLDPLIEIAGLCNENNEILCLQLDTLQGMVNKDYLVKMLERCFINVVNNLGVDINRAAQHKFAGSVLQFVAGLGPRKAASLLNNIFRKGGKITTRAELESYMGPTVYKNCAGFIRIVEKHFTNEELEILDDTRIHPEDYNLVRKIAQDALEGEEDSVVELMKKSDKLDDIDLDAFALELERNGQPRKLNILQDIKQEIKDPFADIRKPYEDPTAAELFTMLTGETETTLRIGQLVNVTVVSVGDRMIKCKMDSGLSGTIGREHASDNPPESLKHLHIQSGSGLLCRVVHIDMEKVSVQLACSTSELRSTTYDQMRLDELKMMEPYLNIEPMETDDKLGSKKKAKPRLFTRKIDHPLFRNLSCQDAEKELQDKEIGELIIRPSSRGYNYLTISWKCYKGVYSHITITEEDKPNARTLGRTLAIGKEKFEGLDEILARYMEPMITYWQDMLNFRNFRHGTQEEVDKLLHEAKQSTPKQIPYFINLAFDFPGRLVLSYLPAARCKHEYINITPEGYMFRRVKHTNPEKLIKWFKLHWKEAPPKRSPPKLDLPPVNPADFDEEPAPPPVYESRLKPEQFDKPWENDEMQLSSPPRAPAFLHPPPFPQQFSHNNWDDQHHQPFRPHRGGRGFNNFRGNDRDTFHSNRGNFRGRGNFNNRSDRGDSFHRGGRGGYRGNDRGGFRGGRGGRGRDRGGRDTRPRTDHGWSTNNAWNSNESSQSGDWSQPPVDNQWGSAQQQPPPPAPLQQQQQYGNDDWS